MRMVFHLFLYDYYVYNNKHVSIKRVKVLFCELFVLFSKCFLRQAFKDF